MNIRALTVFFWVFLVASAALAGEDYRSESRTDGGDGVTIEAAAQVAGKDGKVILLDGSELSGGEQVHGEHKVIIRKEIEKTTN